MGEEKIFNLEKGSSPKGEKGRRKDVSVLAPKGEKERHESTKNKRQMVKGIEAKSSYTQGE